MNNPLLLSCVYVPQECERMNILLAEIKRSLAELDLGLKGDLTISEPMERLMNSLATDTVPASWRNLAYPSLRPLGSWVQNLQQRCTQLTDWTGDLSLPKVVWLSGLFNPQSFLTAVMQTTARRNDWPLDKTVLLTEVTKKLPEQVEAPSRCALVSRADAAVIHEGLGHACLFFLSVGCCSASTSSVNWSPQPSHNKCKWPVNRNSVAQS